MSDDTYGRPENFVPVDQPPPVRYVGQPGPDEPAEYLNREARRAAGDRGPITDKRARRMGWTTVGAGTLGIGVLVLQFWGLPILLLGAAGVAAAGIGGAGAVNGARRWIKNPRLPRMRGGSSFGRGGLFRSRGGGSPFRSRRGGGIGGLGFGLGRSKTGKPGVLGRALAAHTASRRGAVGPGGRGSAASRKRAGASSASTPGLTPARRARAAALARKAARGAGPAVGLIPARPNRKASRAMGLTTGGPAARKSSRDLAATAAKRAGKKHTASAGLRRHARNLFDTGRPFRGIGWTAVAAGATAGKFLGASLWAFLRAMFGFSSAKDATTAEPPAPAAEPQKAAEPAQTQTPAQPDQQQAPDQPITADDHDTDDDSDAGRRRNLVAPPRATQERKDDMALPQDQMRTSEEMYADWNRIPIHPLQEAVVKAYAQMMAGVPSNPVACRDYFRALAGAWGDTGHEAVQGFARRLVDIATDVDLVHDLLGTLAGDMGVAGSLSAATAREYATANELDVQRAERPRPNEAFNNVPGSSRVGQDMLPLVKAFEAALAECFAWVPTSDAKALELAGFLKGLYPMFVQLGGLSAQTNVTQFPGVVTSIANYLAQMGSNCEDIAESAAYVGEAYETDAHHQLTRARAPRVNENLANSVPA